MDRDSFIIHVFCLVVERHQQIIATQPLRLTERFGVARIRVRDRWHY